MSTASLTAARRLAALPTPNEQRAVARYATGASLAAIKRETGIGNTRLRRLLREAGVPRRSVGSPRQNDDSRQG